ncbi:MAG: amino acid adenylation domain-containing protein [Cyanobacteria bacterium P01_H01_bin.15]
MPKPTNSICPRSNSEERRLSFAQQQMWLQYRLDPERPISNRSCNLRYCQELNVAALESALNEIIRRHEVLRSRFPDRGGEATVEIFPELTLKLAPIHLEELDVSESESLVQKWVQQEVQQPFDITCEPLIRAKLLHLSVDEHILLLTFHPMVFDDWSEKILKNELEILYEDFQRATTSSLAELPIQYADFAHWQRQRLSDEQIQTQLAYWHQQLANMPAMLELPTDRPRPEVKSNVGRRAGLCLDADLTRRLKSFSREQDCSLLMTLMAIFQVLLFRYSGQIDIAVGTPVSNRHRAEVEPLLGPFTNTLVIRSQITQSLSFNDFLQQIKQTIIGAYHHQDVPFEQLLQSLKLEQSWGFTPIFQAFFALQPRAEVERNWCSLASDSDIAIFDISLHLHEGDDEQLTGYWSYRSDLFDQATIERMSGHFRQLIQGILTTPTQAIATLPLLTDAERQQILFEWNGTTVDYPYDKSIHELFEEQVVKTPNAIALVYENQSLTYTELNHRVNQLAHYFQSLGVKPEARVGIYLERSLELVISILGILKAGGAYIPLDANSPLARNQFILQDSQPLLLVTTGHLLTDSSEFSCPIVDLETLKETLSKLSINNPASQVQPDALAYIIYTSGSTGEPKGVLIPHQNVIRLFAGTNSAFQFGHHDCWTLFHSYAFDFSVWEIWGALLYGGRLVIVPYEISRDPNEFYQLLIDQQVTVLNQTPSAFFGLIEIDRTYPEDALNRLRYVIFGGEALPIEALAPWWQRHGDQKPRLINMYGITETTVHVTYKELSQQELGSKGSNIGRPIDDLQLYLLDSYLQLVPIGLPGEICVAGAGLARGYLNRPNLTEERFISHPFAADQRLYRSGDLARYRSDGSLEYLGRSDRQVKIRGFRIEIGEIEAHLSSITGIKNALVMVQDSPNDKRLVAYIASDIDLVVANLRNQLKSNLPDYMVPSGFVVVKEFPLTANGKVDRNALLALQPVADSFRAALSHPFVAPVSPTEAALTEIWESLLQVNPIGIDDHFIELGGNSLLAIQMIARTSSSQGIDLTFKEFSDAGTIRSLATVVDQKQLSGPVDQLGPIQRVDRDRDILPISFPQEQVCFMQALSPNILAYQTQVHIRFRGALDVAVLQASCQEIINRHEIFRTTFHLIEGQYGQRIHDNGIVSFEFVSLLDLPQEEREAAMQTSSWQNVHHPFDITQLPLIRWVLYKLGDHEHVLLQWEHHLVHDGWSLNFVLLKELFILYRAFSEGQPSPLPLMPLQFADFGSWQRQWMNSAIAQKQLEYWVQQLADAPNLLPLPTDYPRPAVQAFRGAINRYQLPDSLCKQLSQFTQQKQFTLFVVMVSAYYLLMHRYAQVDDICLGSGFANRQQEDLENLIGMVVNTVILRSNLSKNPTVTAFLEQVRDVVVEASSNQSLPLDKIVEALNPERNLSYSPLAQVVFSFHDSAFPDLSIDNTQVKLIAPIANGSAKYDINIIVIPESQRDLCGIEMVWEYNTDLFEPSTIDRMHRHYETLLAGVITSLDAPINTLPIVTLSERQQLLVDWNQTKTDYPKDDSIHKLFEAQVNKTPNAIAVVDGEQLLTYHELNDRANQLAHYLLLLGLETESRIGICLERSLDLIIGFLAILKAGGAYVPLDLSYPEQRLAHMVQDADIHCLLCRRVGHSRLGFYSGQRIYFEDIPDDIERLSQLPHITGSHLAYVNFTSGSTGMPKGVAVNHRGVVRLVINPNYVSIEEHDVFLQLAPVSFDAATFEIWGALLNGAKLILYPEPLPDLEQLGCILQREAVTILWLTAGLFDVVVEKNLGALASVKQLLAGGDVLSPLRVRQLLDTYPNCTLINGYGPTENTTFTCCYQIPHSFDPSRSLPIGRPIANTQVYVLDHDLEPVPVGVHGELFIGGDGLARGYLNRPELTAQSWLTSPFNPTERLYRTGDIVRYLADGNLEFIGRRDRQVKIRGFRIELGEIEAQLNSIPGCEAAIAVVQENSLGNKRLIAYGIPSKETALDIAAVKEYLVSKLPDYMIPSAVVSLEAFPLTPSGKIDRKALPIPEFLPEERAVAPRDQLEEELVTIWQQVLGIESIGIRDDFFELGGHSLLAIKLFSEIEKKWHRALPLATLFQARTISELATVIRERQYQEHPCLIPIETQGSRPPLFFLPPAGGHMLVYERLARNLGKEQPMYGLEYQLPETGDPQNDSLQKTVAEFINAIRQVQPQGPYHLLGLSFGGLLAWAVAEELERQGETIGIVVLLDCAAPEATVRQTGLARFLSVSGWVIYERVRHLWRFSRDRFKRMISREKSERQRPSISVERQTTTDVDKQRQLNRQVDDIVRSLKQVAQESWSKRLDYWGARLLTFTETFYYVKPVYGGQHYLDDIGDVLDKKTLEMLQVKFSLFKTFRPSPLRCPVLLFRAKERIPSLLTETMMGWDKFVWQDLKVITVSGGHHTIVTSPQLAHYLTQYLHHLRHETVINDR